MNISQAHKAVKWTGTVLLVLVIGIWIASVWRSFVVRAMGRLIATNAGLVQFGYDSSAFAELEFTSGFSPPDDFVLWYWHWYSVSRNGVRMRGIVFPVWILAIPPFLVAAAAWRHDRSRPPGACGTCGYDRTGLAAEALCPECGGASKISA